MQHYPTYEHCFSCKEWQSSCKKLTKQECVIEKETSIASGTEESEDVQRESEEDTQDIEMGTLDSNERLISAKDVSLHKNHSQHRTHKDIRSSLCLV